jgi:hypothetical protein
MTNDLKPVTIASARRQAMAEVQAELDRPTSKEIILNHLWLPAPRHCSCGQRPRLLRAGGLYDWYADHVSVVLADAGFSRWGTL